MFSSIAAKYDRANHLLSLNQDKRWRSELVRWANLEPGQQILDLCTGTGDLAIELASKADVSVTGIDISDQMLAIAKQKAQRLNRQAQLQFLCGNVMALPHANASFDVATIAFGLRNLPDYKGGLAEMLRVLKPGGQAFILEFTLPKGLWGRIYLYYLKNILPVVGGWITGQRGPYEYLDESIRTFPGKDVLSSLLLATGFSDVASKSFLGGSVCVHRAIKS